MLTLLIPILISISCVVAGTAAHFSKASTIASGIAGFIVALFLIGFLIRKKSKRVSEELQDILMSAQKRMNQKIHQFQNKPGGNLKLQGALCWMEYSQQNGTRIPSRGCNNRRNYETARCRVAGTRARRRAQGL